MLSFQCWLEQNEPKKLIIMRALPGAGKSTLAKQLAGPTGKIFSTDEFFLNPEGEYKFDRNMLGKFHQMNVERTKQAMQQGINPIVVDNTNVTSREIKPYALLAKEFGYEVEFKEPNTPWKFNAEELAKRNTHGVPLQSIQNMLNRWEPDLTMDKILST